MGKLGWPMHKILSHSETVVRFCDVFVNFILLLVFVTQKSHTDIVQVGRSIMVRSYQTGVAGRFINIHLPTSTNTDTQLKQQYLR